MNKKAYLAAIILIASITACSSNMPTRTEKEENVGAPTTSIPATPSQPEPKHRADAGKVNRTITYDTPQAEALVEKRTMQAAAVKAPTSMMLHHQLPAQQQQWNRESYNAVEEHGFIACRNDPLSTFAIDVDTASYANIRRFINQGGLPPVGAIRTEEMINYFNYEYPQPTGNLPLAISTEVGPSPFQRDFSLVKIGIKARDLEPAGLPPSNLVFLVDVSGSMNHPNKLGLLKQSLKMLVARLGKNDRVSIVAYAGSDRVVLDPTSGEHRKEILAAIDDLRPGGSTHGSKGIHTAYKLARQVFMPGGNNRVILASDGDFNVGVTSRGELKQLIAAQRDSGIYLTVLGFGMGNYHDDTMEILADKGNGNYAYIDSLLEAKKVLVKEMSGTLYTLAKDVKIQVEFNPALVGAYRLIGYENRALADEDFINDTKDAGEIGVGHTVTALYEIIPAGHQSIPKVNSLKYQQVQPISTGDKAELLTVKVRYKDLASAVSREISRSVTAIGQQASQTSNDFRFAAAIAGYAMLLQDSEHSGDFSWEKCMDLIRDARGVDKDGYRAELLRLVEASQLLVEKRM